MNAQATRRGLPAIALWGGMGALAWAAITVLTGGSSAHADESSDAPLLDGVTSLVSQTVSSVGDTVTAVSSPIVTQVVKPVVTEVVAPVVTQVVAPVQQAAPPVVEHVSDTVTQVPVVGPAAAPVVAAVTDTAQAVVTPVTDLLTEAPVSQIVTPVQDALAALPGVGRLIEELGVDTLLDDVVGVVDATTDVVGGVVENTVPPVLVALDPSRSESGSALPGLDSLGFDVDVRSTSTPPATTAPTRSQPAGDSATSALAPVAPPAAPATSAPESGDTAPFTPPVGGPVTPSSSAGSGGASALSHARLSDVGVPAFRAVERTPGAPDDVLPTSLVADTDVSPD
ncbi:hypothetical protein [Microbacterium sp. Leaf320]|uniref:hypothetical protein n=1 Tax=Microbacterium sp. Leaf320 TaxID=1736334 RepID=UPI0006FAC092|nr:hypothetical protein [Microbacterium sp. Leaf320]KQQ67130.1 hypothetical protein ASF63_07870 [Microbacterium sp. Leaf320]